MPVLQQQGPPLLTRPAAQRHAGVRRHAPPRHASTPPRPPQQLCVQVPRGGMPPNNKGAVTPHPHPAHRKMTMGKHVTCVHQKRRVLCQQCGGSALCPHGRAKHRCRDCGTGLCAHGNFKRRCRDCGTGYCAHGNRKDRCRECAVGYCPHGHRKDCPCLACFAEALDTAPPMPELP